jgi:hypothetical protein
MPLGFSAQSFQAAVVIFEFRKKLARRRPAKRFLPDPTIIAGTIACQERGFITWSKREHDLEKSRPELSRSAGEKTQSIQFGERFLKGVSTCGRI